MHSHTLKQSGVLIPVVILMLACRSTAATSPNSGANASIACQDPRPEICTQIYQPVCAMVDTSVRCVTSPCPSSEHKTYASSCTACADPKVISYTLGPCAGNQ